MGNIEEIVSLSEKVMPTEFSARLREIANEQASAEFKVPVLGGMKAGKSTLLAKMLTCEQSFLPPGVLEATARSVRIAYSFAANRKIVHSDGSETMVGSDEEWDGLVRGKSSLGGDDRLALDLPNTFLRDNRVTIFDTPGNNSVDGAKESETWSALADAQLAIYCVRATSMLSKTDLEFLKTALPQLRNFMFVITRIDEAGISDAGSQEAAGLIAYVRGRLAETFPVKPLGVMAVSSRIEGEKSGIQALKRTVEDVLRQKGLELRHAKAESEMVALFRATLPSVANEIALKQKQLDEGGEAVAAKIGEFKSKLVETEAEKEKALGRLQRQLAQKRLSVRSEIAQCGQMAVERVKSRLESFVSSSELESCSQGLIYSEADQWRNDVRGVMERLSDSGESIMADAASDFLSRLETAAKSDLGVDFKISLADSGRYTVSEKAKDELASLARQAQDARQEIDQLQKEMTGDAEMMPELRRNLEAVQGQLAEIGEYKPQYVERQHVGSDAEGTLRKLGEVADWILLFTPIPMGKLKWLKAFKYGPKICKAVKCANKVIRAKNTFFKNVGKTIPGFSAFFDAFSVEHWMGKLGQAIDQGSTTTVLEEDQEAKKAYEEQVAPFLAQQREIAVRLQGLEAGIQDKRRLLAAQKEREDYIASASELMEREIAEQQRMLDEERERESLFVGKQQLIKVVSALFLSSKSKLLQPILADLDAAFARSDRELSERLAVRMNETLAGLRKQLEQVEAGWNQDQSSNEADLASLRRRHDFLSSVLEASAT